MSILNLSNDLTYVQTSANKSNNKGAANKKSKSSDNAQYHAGTYHNIYTNPTNKGGYR